LGDGDVDVLITHTVPVPLDLLWEEPTLVRVRDRLSRFSRNIWMDFRGFGNSERDLDAPDSMADEVMDGQINAVLNAVGSGRVAIVACGAAGPGAIRYAAAHCERVRALILVNAFASYVRDDDCPWGLPPAVVQQFVDSSSQLFGSGATADLFAPSRAADERFRAWVGRAERVGTSPGNYAERVRAILGGDARDVLNMVTAPTLIIHRRDDRAIRVEAGRYLSARLPAAKYVELPGDDDWFFVGDVDAIFDEVEEFLTGARTAPEGDVVTASVLFTDIVASTAQSARLGHRKWTALIDEHAAKVRATLSQYRGREIKTIGDGFLATFDATTRACRAAVEIVDHARHLGLDVRAGIHVGEVEIRADDVIGLPVSIAKRICDLAGPGEVFISRAASELTIGSGLTFESRGDHTMKGVPGTWPLLAAHE
jgi:class 3 adenylate cyclase/pimeloyl-ACP methyl ester carboxylesterase